MPISNVDAIRSQAAFQNATRGVQPPREHGRLQRFGPRPNALSNGHRQIRAALQIMAIGQLAHAGVLRLAPPSAARPVAPALPGAAAALPDDGSQVPLVPSQGSLAGSFSHLANGALTVCVVEPRRCGSALAGAAAALGTTAAGVLAGYSLGRATAPCPAAMPDPRDLAEDPPSAVLRHLPPTQRAEVLGILRSCDGDRSCALPHLRAVLARLPSADQHALARLLGEPEPSNPQAGGWPPGAVALALPDSWMDHAAELLAGLEHLNQAQLRMDVDAISQATLDAQRTAENTVSHPRFEPALERNVTRARMDAIRDRFRSEGMPLQEQPFTINAVNDMGEPGLHSGRNLWLELVGQGPVQRTLMLVAHGDAPGASLRSGGAWDNASGVAALQELARRFHDAGVPAGLRVQLLVTDLGDEGMIGAKAFVQRCQAAGTCPDLAVNLDRLGWGTVLGVSGTDRHSLVADALEFPAQRDQRAVAALEADFAQRLRASGDQRGLPVADSRDWSLASDQIPFQREGLPALGLSQSTPEELDHDVRFRDARNRLLEAEQRVNWTLYEDYSARRLEPSMQQTMRQQLAAWRSARADLAAEGLPRSQRIPGTAQDQSGGVDARRVMQVVDVVHDALLGLQRNPAR